MTDGLNQTIMPAETMSVNMPSMMPFGMSRFGSIDSSAASGSCSIARNSHTAKGSAARTPDAEREERPVAFRVTLPSGAMLSAQALKSMCGNAMMQKKTRTASASSVTTSVTPNDSATPKMLSANEHDVAQHPPDGLEFSRRLEDAAQIRADEEDDDRRRQHVLDVFAKAGDEAAPRTHRRARERIGRARMRQRRSHLGDAEIRPRYMIAMMSRRPASRPSRRPQSRRFQPENVRK